MAKGSPPRPLADRFWEKVDKSGDCWLWTAFRMKNGYGTIGIGTRREGKKMFAHRASWEIHNGPIPPGMFVCHRCDNPGCVRPDHLFLGTPKDNMQDMIRKGRNYYPGAKGERNTKAKLTDADVPVVHALYLAGLTQTQIGARLGVTQSSISSILRGETWRHIRIAA